MPHNGTWRVDRPATTGNHTEWFGDNQEAAEAREHQLRLAGATLVVSWWDAESTGPWVPETLDGAA